MTTGETPVTLRMRDFLGGRRIPIIRSAAAAECGLTCIAMIAIYHGHKINLASLRERYPVSMKGTTLQTLILIARDLQLSASAFRLGMNGLRALRTPCILHWNMNHFVVLKKVTHHRVIIHDPSCGLRTLSFKAASDAFTGVALELEPEKNFKPLTEKKPTLRLRDFWSQSKGLGLFLFQIFLLSLPLQALALLSPLYIQIVVDQVIGKSNVSPLIALTAGFALIALLRATIGFFREFISMRTGTSLSLQLNNHLLSHALRLPLAFFEARHTGDVLSRFDSLENIKSFLSGNFVAVMLDGFMLIASLIFMLIYSGWLTGLVFAFALAGFVLRVTFSRTMRDITEEKLQAAAHARSNLIETIRAMPGIKIFGRESHRQQMWNSLSAEQYNLDIRLGRWNLSLKSVSELLFGLENTIIIAAAAWMIINSKLTLGMLLAFIAYKIIFVSGAQRFLEKLGELRMLSLHLERISDVAATEPEDEAPQLQAIITPEAARGSLELRNISYRYGAGEPWILENVSLIIEPGTSLALVGPSGSGKTTLMKIALGLLRPQSGEVLFDGINIERLGLKQYRRFIGAVMQDDHLLSGTLADNICFFDPEPDHDRIHVCARLASIHEDILRMPMRYNTLTGDMGSSLSGGQKQRILLARALYERPKILFLDEATSHLDRENERLTSEALCALDVTRLIIAHRTETIDMADRIFTLSTKQEKPLRHPVTAQR